MWHSQRFSNSSTTLKHIYIECRVFHTPHKKWILIILQSECSFIFPHTHKLERKRIWSYIQIFSGRKKISVKLFVQDGTTCTVIFSQESPPISNIKCNQALNALTRHICWETWCPTYLLDLYQRTIPDSQNGLQHFVVPNLWRINKNAEYQQRSCDAEKDSTYS